MGDPKKHITYTLTDIEQYLKGKLSPAEMHELEKAALQDPFLAEAIEGYESVDLDQSKKNLAEIQDLLLQEKREDPKIIPITSPLNKWWKIAAAILLLVGAGTISWYLLNNDPVKIETAQTTPQPVKKDTVKQNLAVTTQPANTKQQPVSIIPNLEKENKAAASELYAAELAKKMESKKEKQSQLAMMQLPAPQLRDQANATASEKVAADSFFNDASISGREAKTTSRSNFSGFTVSGNTSNSFGGVKAPPLNTFSGRVVNAYNYQPIPNTVITIPKTNRGIFTDANGYFTFSSHDSIQKIQISSVGFEQKDLFAKASIPNEIVMKPATNELNEVVVIGYGTSKKKDMTGSVAITRTEPPEVINHSLQGSVAGVNVSSQRKPIQIRGAGSSTNNNPLFVIDGVPTYNTWYIDPNSIEKIEILKDSAAASLYGASGSKGVVLVTTRKATNKNPVVKDITTPEGGWKSLTKYLKKKINIANENNTVSLQKGAITIALTLKDGKVQDVEILQTFNDLFNQPLIQALKDGPAWKSSVLPNETGKRTVIIVL
jgi:TonB-dependent SusC/RagA subfamily outer membrane receptor